MGIHFFFRDAVMLFNHFFLAIHYGIIKYSIIFLYYLCNFQFFTFWVTPPGIILLRSLWTHMQDSCQVVYWEALLSNHNGDHFNFILNIANYLQNGCACAFSFETILRSFGVLMLHLSMLPSAVWEKWWLVVACIPLSLIGGEVKNFWYLSAIYRNSLCVPGINPR